MFNKTNNPFSKPTASAATASLPQNTAPSGNGRPAAPAQPMARPGETTTVAGSVPTPASTITESGSRLIVGPDVKLKSAEILDCDTLVVEGRVEATMDSRVIRIAEHGIYAGKVSIDIAEIHGHFEGELTARSQLLIHATGKVSGKVRYGKMLIEEGGQISGEIRSLAEEELPAARPRPEMLASVKTAMS